VNSASIEAPPERPTRRKTWVAAITLIVAGIGGLAAWALMTPNAVAYYKTPSEMNNATGERIRLGGRIVDGSLRRDGTVVRFQVTDGTEQVAVRYAGEVPDTLKDGTDVIAEGHARGDTFVADRVLAKCSSKFVPKDKQEHLGRT
jgi:cytochrome c-type biogenesis protein CcmE